MLEEQDAPAWLTEANNYAATLIGDGQLEVAVTTYYRALALEPAAATLWSNLGSALWSLRRYGEAEAALLRALALKPDYPLALVNLGMVYEGQGRLDAALEAFNQGIAADPDYVLLRWNRAILRLNHGEYEAGFAEYDSRLLRKAKEYPRLANQAGKRIPMWQGEDLEGKLLHVEVEQGIGDTILFSRFLPMVAQRAHHVTLCCSADLASLLWHHRPDIEFLPQRVPVPDVDYYAYLGSLPRWLGVKSPADVPPDPGLIRQRANRARKQIDLPNPGAAPAYKIGICWTGNPEMDRNAERSVPFEKLITLARDPRVWLYSLQLGPGAQRIRELQADGLVQDLSPQMRQRGLVGTATAILQCDLVITSCTMVAHMACALGVPTWVMLCVDPYWPWMSGTKTTSAWWPTARLFRQRHSGDWDQVIDDVRSALNGWIAERI